MAWLGNIASSVLRNIVFAEVPSNEVQQISNNEYHKRQVHCREDGIMLYIPRNVETEKYEIVLHRRCSECFCLFRSKSLQEAETRFIIYKDKVPVLVEVCPNMFNVKQLQTLCDLLMQHPTWNVAHVAAHLLLTKAFTHNSIKKFVNKHDEESGISPLQVAIETKNLSMVQAIITAEGDLKHLDFYENNVYHYAAITTKEIIEALKSVSSITINKQNKHGYTPLHIACINDKLECVRELLQIGADINTSAPEGVLQPAFIGDFLLGHSNGLTYEEINLGGTLLHCCSSIEVINELIDGNLNINAVNINGRTALHIMVIRKLFQCVAALLSHMADVNLGDDKGNTPLHIAVTQSTPEIVQLLIAFGSDVNKPNHNSQTPRHLANSAIYDSPRILYLLHAVGAKRCPPNNTGCHIGCKHDENFNGIAPQEPPTAPLRTTLDQMLYVSGMAKMASMRSKPFTKGGRLLCLDGGGIRGLVLVQTLLEIEAVLQKPIISCFDWIAGTSTGGILAFGLATGKSLKECQALYFRIKNEAFVGSRPYSNEPLENTLKECLGNTTVMSDIRHPKIMVTGVLADRRPVDLHIFRNYESPNDILRIPPSDKFKKTLQPEEQLIWKAARATGAAPTYFRAFGRFLDGGLIANNPTLDAMTEIHEYNLALEAAERSSEITPVSIVVSLGTGLIPVSPQSIDFYLPATITETAKMIPKFQSLSNLVVDQATCTDGRVVDRARTWCSMIGVPYFRFNPQLSAEVAMNEKSDTILAEMMWTTKAFMYANRDQIKELAAVLDSIS